MKTAIIGTAGRDKTKPMTLSLWEWMVNDATRRVPKGTHLVSGGAAWADHLAVKLYLNGHTDKLTLHLPAPFTTKWFVGPGGGSASAANYYHERFSQIISIDSLLEIRQALEKGAIATFESYQGGYEGMFARNLKVAQADEMLAYTFGLGRIPADGGTRDTWDHCKGIKTHIPLPLNPVNLFEL